MESQHWWQDAIVYQVYVRSFADANGDGVGDLDGHPLPPRTILSALGVDAIWLNPCYPSPQFDHGYDVAGLLRDPSRVRRPRRTSTPCSAEAHEHGIKVLMDLVPNHCSSEHAWFVEALAAPAGQPRAEPASTSATVDPTVTTPTAHHRTTGLAAFGGSAWTRASPTDPQWYLGTFTPHQPDFDHTDDDVHAMFDEVLQFWFDRGVEGFRSTRSPRSANTPNCPTLRRSPRAPACCRSRGRTRTRCSAPRATTSGDDFGARSTSYMERHPGRDLMMVAEAYMNGRPDLMKAFVNDEQFHQAFAFDLLLSPWVKSELERAVRDTLDIIALGSSPTWTLNNHDVQRVVTRLGRDNATDPSTVSNNALEATAHSVDVETGLRRSRAIITLAMALPGSLYLYMGEELGLPEYLDMPAERRQDPVFIQTDGRRIGRDGCRVPLPWTIDPATAFGFSSTAPGDTAPEPWLPQPDWWGTMAVGELDGRDGSTLELYRQALDARREFATSQGLVAAVIDLGDGLVAVRRGDLAVVTNVTSAPIALDMDDDHLAIATPVFASAPAEMHTPGVIPPDSTIWFVS